MRTGIYGIVFGVANFSRFGLWAATVLEGGLQEGEVTKPWPKSLASKLALKQSERELATRFAITVDTDVELTQLSGRSRPSLILPEPSAVLRLCASGGGSTRLQHMDQFGTSANTQCAFLALPCPLSQLMCQSHRSLSHRWRSRSRRQRRPRRQLPRSGDRFNRFCGGLFIAFGLALPIHS